jgi:hypothetical protein
MSTQENLHEERAALYEEGHEYRELVSDQERQR